MDVPQPLTDLGFDTATTARLGELLKVTLEATCKKIFAESQMSAVAVSKSPGTELKAADKLKATDLRTALLLGKIPVVWLKTKSQLEEISRMLSGLINGLDNRDPNERNR